jgi:alpha-beta hydrolase superfamily lysophospholipase
VAVFHGIESHPGWFLGTGEHLCRPGWDVFLPTRRGSGLDPVARGDAPGGRRLLQDVDEVLDRIALTGRYGQIHAVGISWGGKLLTAWALQRQRQARLTRLVLVSPGIRPIVDVSLATKLAIGACLLLRPGRCFGIPLDDPGLFTPDPHFQAFIRNDPLRLHQATARFLLAGKLLEARIARARGGCLEIPTGLILANRDSIIDTQATLECVERLTGSAVEVHQQDWPHTPEFVQDPGPYYRALGRCLGMHESDETSPTG